MSQHTPTYLCPSCGYDLAPRLKSQELCCPECGQATTLAHAKKAGDLGASIFSRRIAVLVAIGPTAFFSALFAGMFGDGGSLGFSVLGGAAYFFTGIVAIFVTAIYLFIHRSRRPVSVRRGLPVLFLLLCLLVSFTMYALTVWFVIRPAIEGWGDIPG